VYVVHGWRRLDTARVSSSVKCYRSKTTNLFIFLREYDIFAAFICFNLCISIVKGLCQYKGSPTVLNLEAAVDCEFLCPSVGC